MNIAKANHGMAAVPNEKAGSLHTWIVCILSGAVGFILLAAAAMKATDMELFIRQISAYGLITQPFLVALGAWGMIVFQFTLGTALLLLYRPKLTLSVAALLWAFLTFLTAYAWASGTTDDCGCYGSWLKSTPRQATFENIAFLMATLAARWLSATFSPGKSAAKSWAMAAAPLAGIVLPLFFGFSLSAMTGSGSHGVNLESGRIQGLGGIDLARGSYLVVLMGTDCAHCKELLPDIDMLAEESDVPKVVALSKNNEAQRKEFVEKYEPLFPIGQADDKLFWRLLGTGKMPRIMLVQEGKVTKVWDRTVPEKEAIKSTARSQKDKTESTG